MTDGAAERTIGGQPAASDITAAHFFAGVLGSSMLRRWYVDGRFNEARMAELRRVLDGIDDFPNSLVLNPVERDLETGYAEWAAGYDGPNPLIETEEPVVHPILRSLGGHGVPALDAACGTGRHARFLAEIGCTTTGADRSSAMLAIARAKVSGARFEQAELDALPFGTGEFQLAVISLALCHLADPTPALHELARVLAPGGHLVVADPHPMSAVAGGQAFYGGITPGKPMTWVRNHYHCASAWLTAFRAAGLTVEDCHEVATGDAQIDSMPTATLFPEATRALLEQQPALWVWVLGRA